ncbi:PREDICTED: uncharacterized protein LOC109585515 [Amphimedon queenslandica]|uniref:Uncharacterized protein n=1 Tax=Amphimedon queenslandica TaxID=400682 RepID=A0AAN0JJQ4_AMPQE|nr:PREDICTED: uncharacterized protein LOC109585515 [Amphimedon queenslandica]|eukprot:XP_019857204.1 PREDICTED: uncharacterized protein LOC109585515 [Amphimedon queenslandica]
MFSFSLPAHLSYCIALSLLILITGINVTVGTAPDRLPDTPAEGLDPMPVTPEVISIAQKMKKNAEKKLKTSFTTYTPLYYIKKGESYYCIRVLVDDGIIDVFGKYCCAGYVSGVKAKHVNLTFF